MKFVHRLKISSLLSFGLLAVLMPLLFWSLGEMKTAEENDNLADDLQATLFKRATLCDEFFLHGEERARVQGLAVNEDLGNMLRNGRAKFTGREERLALLEMQSSFDEAAQIYLRFAELQRRFGRDGRLAIDSEPGKRLHGQILLKTSALQGGSARLQSISRKRCQHNINRAIAFSVAFVGLVGVVALFNVAMFNRLFSRRLATLRRGAEIIASGGLNHRLHCSGSDELAELARVLNVMTERVQDYMEQLHESQKRVRLQLRELSTIYTHTPVGMFAVDRQLRYLRVNERLAAINGRSVEEHLNRTVDEVLPAELAGKVKQTWLSIFDRGESVLNLEIQGEVHGTPGRHHWLTSYVPIFSDSGEVCGITGTVIDITDRKQTELELEVTIAFLHLINSSTGSRDLVAAATTFFRERSGCLGVSFRLWQDDQYPFLEESDAAGPARGNGKLCSSTDPGAVCCHPHIGCLFDEVISGKLQQSRNRPAEGGGGVFGPTA